MALLPTESWHNGFVVDTATQGWVLVTSFVGALVSAGFLRDPDGRLVVIYV